ncbi:MAG: hypothetical protein AAF392_01125 [Bacteroidota bacterium]
MKRLASALLVCILALASIAYRYYTSWRSEIQTSVAIPYIPQSAALVYEVDAAGKQWATFQQTAIAQDLSHLPFFIAIQEGLNFLEDLGTDKEALNELPLVASIHGLREGAADYIFYFNTHETGTQALLLQLLEKVKQYNICQIEERKYAGYTITVLSSYTSTKQLYLIKQGHYIIASFSSLLIEDVVRGLKHKNRVSFLCFKKVLSKQGSIYVNFSKLPQLLRIFFKSDFVHSIDPTLGVFAPSSQLELKLTNHHLLLNGFATSSDTAQLNFVQTLAGQTCGAFTLAPYIPQCTAFLQHFTFRDAREFASAFQQYRKLHQPSGSAEQELTSNSLATALDALLKGEIGLCTMGKEQMEQLLFIQVKHREAWMAVLEEFQLLAKPLTRQSSQLAAVYPVKPDVFCHWLPGNLFPSFQPHFLTMLDNCIILANSSTALETLEKQYMQGKTWANTAHQRSFLDSTLEQAHFSLFVNTQQAWSPTIHALKPAWKSLFERHAAALQCFAQASLQLVYEEQDTSSCYLSLLLQHRKEEQPQSPPSKDSIDALQYFQAEAPIISKPFVVKTHKNEALHTLLQDALYQVYFLDAAGKLIWKKALEGPILTDIFAVDYYKNNKIQYLWATRDTLHLIDRNGQQVASYPQKLPGLGRISWLNVVDYAEDKHYRFLIADTHGNIYLRDKRYRPLPGWNPKALHSPFAATPFHIRINRDYLLALQENGNLQALNRKGQAYPGFPIDLEETIHNPLVVKKGNTAASTSLITLTDEGKLNCCSLEGLIQNSIQLDKPESTMQFSLCPDVVAGHTYAIMRQGLDKFAILDEKGNFCFEKDHEAEQALLCQYYDFEDYKFYVMTDRGQHCTYIYDSRGKAIHDAPLRNSHEVSLAFSKANRQLIVYSNFKDRALKYLLPVDYY